MSIGAVRLHPEDNVLCLLRDHAEGEVPEAAGGPGPALREPVALGHKVALAPIGKGEEVRKYGVPIGRATRDIPEGGHVHLHNLKGFLDQGEVQ
jgi:altronate hydrolase